MKRFLASVAWAVTGMVLPNQASPSTILWADLISRPTPNIVVGTLGSTTVTFTGSIAGVELGGGKNYWHPFPSADGPVASDFIALNIGGLKTISFSAPVADLYLALMSWDVDNTMFSKPLNVMVQGCGYFGCGTATVDAAGTHLVGVGELHGILHFAGPISSLSFVDDTEDRHVFQIGIGAVPEPATWAMMIAGFGAVGLAMRRRRTVAASFA